MMTKKLSAKAFSLLEMSIVIVIIGLLISAILTGNEMMNDAKLAQARSMTQNSPVVSISDLVLWLDTTSEKSFSKAEAKDGATISRWNDISPESSVTNYFTNTSATATDHPVYKENCINGLPCLYFNGTSGSKIIAQKSLGIRTAYISIFIVLTGSESATSTYSSTLFNSNSSGTWTDSTSGMFYLRTSMRASPPAVYDMTSTYGIQYGKCTSVAYMVSKQKYIYSLVDDNSSSIYHYVNGVVANNSGSNGGITKTLGFVNIGNASYKGNIGEIIVFSKALSTTERKSVEQYLSKKWDIKVAP